MDTTFKKINFHEIYFPGFRWFAKKQNLSYSSIPENKSMRNFCQVFFSSTASIFTPIVNGGLIDCWYPCILRFMCFLLSLHSLILIFFIYNTDLHFANKYLHKYTLLNKLQSDIGECSLNCIKPLVPSLGICWATRKTVIESSLPSKFFFTNSMVLFQKMGNVWCIVHQNINVDCVY